ncbi:hypothetical protein [Microbulbifer guangxiensis]|uniref:hypothetical protein n=1 Tax=Microbulbifer guangxiensis TaxID=2904249 RepID=UPI001F26DDD5|nr:hypothetical protein [Microbulbifer guangxiensis]
MNFSDREKQLIRAAFAWGQIAHQEGFELSDLEIEKSVLFRRLLAGRPALTFPPPLRHGFPWYEVIEGRNQFVVNASEPSPDCSIIAPGSRPGDTCILIDGSLWRVAETVKPGQEYIVEWGAYPIQWRLRKHWEVNYEMTRQLHQFRQENPSAEIRLDPGNGPREWGELRIDDQQTVWLSEWHLGRIGLSGWVWVGHLEQPPARAEFTPLFEDDRGPLLLAEGNGECGVAWLRVEQAGEESRFIRLGNTQDYRSLVAEAMGDPESLIQGIEGNMLEVMDCRGLEPLRRLSVPTHLAPLEEFDLGKPTFDLVPENARDR